MGDGYRATEDGRLHLHQVLCKAIVELFFTICKRVQDEKMRKRKQQDCLDRRKT